MVTAVTQAAAPTNVSGSDGVRPKSRLDTVFIIVSTPATPETTPMATIHEVSRISIEITSCRLAPRAIRIPISLVRWVTPMDSVP